MLDRYFKCFSENLIKKGNNQSKSPTTGKLQGKKHQHKTHFKLTSLLLYILQ